jgi:hypothetical protein
MRARSRVREPEDEAWSPFYSVHRSKGNWCAFCSYGPRALPAGAEDVPPAINSGKSSYLRGHYARPADACCRLSCGRDSLAT